MLKVSRLLSHIALRDPSWINGPDTGSGWEYPTENFTADVAILLPDGSSKEFPLAGTCWYTPDEDFEYTLDTPSLSIYNELGKTVWEENLCDEQIREQVDLPSWESQFASAHEPDYDDAGTWGDF